MKKAKTKQETISDKLYYPFRIAILISVIFLFIPALNPVRISGMINRNLSLFTSGISYSTLTAEFGRALKKVGDGVLPADSVWICTGDLPWHRRQYCQRMYVSGQS